MLDLKTEARVDPLRVGFRFAGLAGSDEIKVDLDANSGEGVLKNETSNFDNSVGVCLGRDVCGGNACG
jgi:hypothetical protein